MNNPTQSNQEKIFYKCPDRWEASTHHMPVMCDPRRFKVIVWHRKARKTTMVLGEVLRRASLEVGVYWYVAPYLSQARRIVWEDPEMMPKYCPMPIWEKRNNSNLTLRMPNGSIIYVMGADNPDSLRGPNPRGVIFDEYDQMDPYVWSGIVQPIMMNNPKAWCWFVGTFDGKKDLFAKYNYAIAHPETWQASLLGVYDTNILSIEQIKEAQETTSEAYFKQEYLCDPIESASAVFRNVDACVKWVNPHTGILEDWQGNDIPRSDHKYQTGVDLAKFQDFTVLTTIDLMTFRVQMPVRFNQVDYTLQKARIELAYIKWQKGLVRLDRTGVGEPIFEDLARERIKNIEGFVFTADSKRNILTNLQLLIEQTKITLPNDEGLIGELKSMQYVMTDSGKVTMRVPSGATDDRIMSLALACWELPEKPLKVIQDELESRIVVKQFDANKKQRTDTGSRYLRRR